MGLNNHPFILLFLLLFCCTAFAQQREEFNGPMQGWANVKTRFNAKGDGKQDDTRALQQALDSLTCWPVKFNTGRAAYTVIYLPKGRYRITRTLQLRGKIGINIIGEDPANTIIEWDGNAKDTMLWTNGSAYFKIGRISFDGKQKADVEGLGIHWLDRWNDGTSRSFASLNIEVSDCNFRGLTVGIGGGYYWNDSEVKINRCSFYSCTRAGIEIMGYNALDYWVWYCRFYDCYIGVNNSRGNYHLYNCYFRGSVISDIVNTGGYYTSVRGCFSELSTSFSIDNGLSSNPFKRIFQDNIIKQTRDLPVYYHHIGKPVFIRNRFDKTKSDTTGRSAELKGKKVDAFSAPAVLDYSSWAASTFSVLSIENQYFYPKPFRVVTDFPKKNYVIRDTYGKRVNNESADFLKKMPVTPPFRQRTIFEVPTGAGTEQIQEIINQAATLKGNRPVVHFRYGTYNLTRTIIIPPGSDMQIVGDGMRYSTTITATNPSTFRGNCILKVQGPSYIEIRDLQFGTAGAKKLIAIVFDKVDQQQSRVYLDQLYATADTTLFIDKLNYTAFEKNNSFFTDGNVIIGGSKQKAGQGTLKLYCFGGSYARLTVRNNAKFVSKDCWWEGETRVPLDLVGDGDITIDGTKIAPNQGDSISKVRIGRFNGRITLMNTYVQCGMEMTGNNPNLKFFLWNANFYFKKDIPSIIPRGMKGQVAFAGITAQCFIKEDKDCDQTRSFKDRFVNIRDENKFIDEMTRQTRDAVPVPYTVLPKGISNIYLSRVLLDSYVTGLYFAP
jgi:hypothetical protein